MDARPARGLAVVACMDARLDLFGAFGLEIGDVHVIRNAGGLITDDVLRSLAISQRKLGTRAVAIVHHTNCGMAGFDDGDFRDQLAAESGVTPAWDVPGFTDIDAQLRRSVEAVRTCPWLPYRDDLRGYVYDVQTAELQATI